uniref:Uncharacterized protein n=1 Tax=viral metagenome TaxID=1070528 RepID=A0A6C0IE95_9ZZZZ
MNFIQVLRSNTLYFLLSLPLLIILYEFFLSCSLGNRSVIILLIGQLVIVPIVSLLITFLHSFTNTPFGNGFWLLISWGVFCSFYYIFTLDLNGSSTVS